MSSLTNGTTDRDTIGAGHPRSARDAGGERSEGYSSADLGLVLFGLQSPINIGLILRIAEAYQFAVNILDQHRVLDDPSKLRTVSDFACGALPRRGFHRLDSPESLAGLRQGRRLVATSIGQTALPLPDYQCEPGDLIVFGNEYDGLPDDVVGGADVIIQVPIPVVWMPKQDSYQPIDPLRTTPVARDGQPSLNVAVTAGIVCYSAYASWLAGHRSGSGATKNLDIPSGA